MYWRYLLKFGHLDVALGEHLWTVNEVIGYYRDAVDRKVDVRLYSFVQFAVVVDYVVHWDC
jgi:hypothetical protein